MYYPDVGTGGDTSSYGIFALVTQSFHGGEINSDVAKRRLFSLTKYINKIGLIQYSFLV